VSLISLIVLLVVVGVILWAINRYVPMEATMKNILNLVVIIIVCIYLLTLFGLLPDLQAIRIG
jgi:predicted membrane protein